jgi:cytochrome c2
MTGLAGYQRLGTRAMPRPQKQAKPSPQPAPDHLVVGTTNEFTPLRQQVEAARKKAFDHGSYACCIEPACSWCLLSMGECTCILGVGSGQYACRECKGGWEAGQGIMPGKRKEDVRKMKTIALVSDRQSRPADQMQEADQVQDQETSATRSPQQKRSGVHSSGVNSRDVALGEKRFRSSNCLSCHQWEGKGSAIGPDLTHEARRHADIAWQIGHLQHPDKVHPGSTMPHYDNLKPEELRALAAFLVTRE